LVAEPLPIDAARNPVCTGIESSRNLQALTDLPLKLSYRTGRDDLVRDFFTPCLGASVIYRRAAGYFTSASLALAARGVASLASRHGKMHLVVSPHLEPDDVAALRRAQDNPSAVLRSIVARGLGEIEDALIRDRLNALAWLATAGMLEIKLALRIDSRDGFRRGLFHVKSGVFSDTTGAHVAFTGSANETAGGLVDNFEHLDVFRSWTDPENRVQTAIDDFETLWHGNEPTLRVIEFSQASAELLERFRDPNAPPPGVTLFEVREPGSQAFTPPPGLELRPYQKDAIRAWSQAKGKVILAMATGAGKTLTAKLAKFIQGADANAEVNQSAMRLLIRRARLLGAAANKLTALDTLLAGMDNPPKKAIFYCGDGRTTDQINKEETRQIQAVARLLGERHQLRVRNFTYREGPAERDDILRDFGSGFLDGIVAIRCLDEGIDLPNLGVGFLLAS
jgi:hypothetical protein